MKGMHRPMVNLDPVMKAVQEPWRVESNRVRAEQECMGSGREAYEQEKR